MKDTLGKEVMYSCPGGCNRKQLEKKVSFSLSLMTGSSIFFRRQIFNLQCLQGYKEFVVHMASFHGGLDMVMAMDPREEVNVFIKKSILLYFGKPLK